MFQDIFGLPESTNGDLQIYRTGTASWHTWNRPRGKSMCTMIVIGAGSGGGGGLTGATATVRGGGAVAHQAQ